MMSAVPAPLPPAAAPPALDPASSAQAAATAHAPGAAVTLHFTGDPDASILPRALETILRRGAAPRAVEARLEPAGWRIALTLDAVTAAEARHIALTIGQIVGVGAVVMEPVR